MRNWPKPRSHEAKVEDAIDRLMLVELWLFWYIAELEDLKAQLSMDPLLRLLVPIVEAMINQLWQLMRRWIAIKAEVIKAVREGLAKKERKIEGNGFRAEVKYNRHIIDLNIIVHGVGGDYTEVPDLGIDREILRAMRIGWRASDSSDDKDKYPRMETNFVWQVLSWLITMPSANADIHARGISVTKDDVKPMWELKINGFSTEWLSDNDAYQEMSKLPKELFLVAFVHAVFGDGHDAADRGRVIELGNDDRNVLELMAKKIEDEFGIKGTISPAAREWRYEISGEGAKIFAEIVIMTMEKLAPQIKRLYDLMMNYELIKFEKWVKINRISRYVFNESKVLFAGFMWTPAFKWTIVLKIATKNVTLAEEIKKSVEKQGIDAVVKKGMWKGTGEIYEVKILWSTLQKYLCNDTLQLKTQLIQAALKAIENCHVWNLMHDAKKNCDEIPATQWLRKLTDSQYIAKLCKDV